MSKVHFGGIPTDVDVRKLADAFGVPAVGCEISHEDVERALGVDRHQHRYRTVTVAWRKKLEDSHGVVIGCIPGVGFRSLDEGEQMDAGFDAIKSGARKQLRGIKRAGRVKTNDPTLLKKQDLAVRYGIALAAEHNSMMKQIEPPKPQQQLPRLVRKRAGES
ncbi:MAG: hypothetical protein HY855_24990 [Burkholderiales bacterium]|nr:hypothetical protein [Burkholderiales bacterium]